MKETEIYFRFLLAIIAADGIIATEEEKYILSAMNNAGIDNLIIQNVVDVMNHVKNGDTYKLPDDFYAIVKSSGNIDLITSMIKDACEIAMADGDFDPSEEKIIKGLSDYLTQNSCIKYEQIRDWALRSIELKREGVELLGSEI